MQNSLVRSSMSWDLNRAKQRLEEDRRFASKITKRADSFAAPENPLSEADIAVVANGITLLDLSEHMMGSNEDSGQAAGMLTGDEKVKSARRCSASPPPLFQFRSQSAGAAALEAHRPFVFRPKPRRGNGYPGGLRYASLGGVSPRHDLSPRAMRRKDASSPYARSPRKRTTSERESGPAYRGIFTPQLEINPVRRGDAKSKSQLPRTTTSSPILGLAFGELNTPRGNGESEISLKRSLSLPGPRRLRRSLSLSEQRRAFRPIPVLESESSDPMAERGTVGAVQSNA